MAREVHNKLTAVKVRQLRKPGRYADGSGLYLHVSDTGSKWWVWRGTVNGRRRELGLLASETPEIPEGPAAGEVTVIPLAEARAIARKYRRLARQGIDPAVERDKDRDRSVTFADAVDRYLEAKLAEFSSEKHKYQWRATLQTAVKVLGKMRVDEIEVGDVLRVLKPMWGVQTETASRLRGRIERVLAWATVNGYRTGDNPARWRGYLSEALPKPDKVADTDKQPALAMADAPAWWRDLAGREGMGAEALKFLALTAARSGEVRGMEWREVDFDKALWTVPAARMKARREHVVPLTPEALAVLEGVRGLDAKLAFPSPQRKPGGGASIISDMSVNAVMRRMHAAEVKDGRPGWLDSRSKRPAVPHGLRSTFRDWAAERGFDHVLAELALAHDVGSETERAYRRTGLIEARRAMMAAWGRALRGEAEPAGNVLQLGAAG